MDMYMYCYVFYFDKIFKNWCLINDDEIMIIGFRYNYLVYIIERS